MAAEQFNPAKVTAPKSAGSATFVKVTKAPLARSTNSRWKSLPVLLRFPDYPISRLDRQIAPNDYTRTPILPFSLPFPGSGHPPAQFLGMAKWAAEKLIAKGKKCQGTTGVPSGSRAASAPKSAQALQAAEKLVRAVGRGFIPGTKPIKSMVGFSP
jgi:hypothetical protein